MPPASFGRFRLLHQVGAGVLGPVYRGHDPDDDRLVAIKVFRFDIPPERAADLARELQSLVEAGLAHPSLVVLIAAGMERSLPFLVEDYVAADSLDAALRQYGPAPVPQAMGLLTQLAGALDYAAALGLHHGGLHPRDILVAPAESRLTGVGIAQALEHVGLNPAPRRAYSSPERIDGRTPSSASDVYSLAVVAHELLTGRRPIAVESRWTMRLDGLPAVTGHLEEVFRIALATSPDDRFPAALEFVTAMQDVFQAYPAERAGEPASVAPVVVPAPAARRRPSEPSLPFEPEKAAPPEGILAPEIDLSLIPLSREASEAPAVVLDLRKEFGEFAGPAPGLPDGPEFTDLSLSQADALPETVSQEASLPETVALGPSPEESVETVASGVSLPETVALEPSPEESVETVASDVAVPGSVPPVPLTEALPATVLSDGSVEVLHSTWERQAGAPAVEAAPVLEWEDGPPAEPARSHPGAGEAHESEAGVAPSVTEPALADAAGLAEPDRQALPPQPNTPAVRRRSLGLPLALMLFVGLLAGFAAGYVVGTNVTVPDEQVPRAPTSAATTSAATPAAGPGGGREGIPPPAGPAAVAGVAAGGAGVSAERPPSAAGASGRTAGGSREVAPAGAAAPKPQARPGGQLTIRSTPAGARVLLNGRDRGRTPVSLQDLAPGRYALRLSRPGYVNVDRELVVPRDTQLTIPLKRAAAPQRSSPATAPTTAGAPATPAPTPPFVGTLVVDSLPPGASVFLDGKLVGKTPLVVPDVPAGSHVVRLEMNGYRRWSSATRVVAGERIRVSGSLEAEQTQW